MSLKCKKCGASFNQNHVLKIDNNSSGYRCKRCLTVHSWITGLPEVISKPAQRRSALGSVNRYGGEIK